MTDNLLLDDVFGELGATQEHPQEEPRAIAEPSTQEDLQAAAARVDLTKVEAFDETVAEALRLHKQRLLKEGGFKEGTLTKGQAFKSLKPMEKAALLATTVLDDERLLNVGMNAPMWIDESKVPDTLHLHWICPLGISVHGMRGYTPVRLTRETQKWVPNARQKPAAKFITFGTYTLCAIDSDEYYLRLKISHDRNNRDVDAEDPRFRSAMKSISGAIGMSKTEAERIDSLGRGFVVRRGGDPDQAAAARAAGVRPSEVSPDRVE